MGWLGDARLGLARAIGGQQLRESGGVEIPFTTDFDTGEFHDSLYRQIEERSKRDLSSRTHERQLRIAYWLYLGYPLAYRGMEITRDFVVGEGISFRAADAEVQTILNRFWNDPINRWDLKQFQRVLELGLYGEQFYPVEVNPVNGHVRMGYIDPLDVVNVRTDPENVEIIREIDVREISRYQVEPAGACDDAVKTLKVIGPDDDPQSDNFGRLCGEVFVFQTNKVSNATRGNSDLLPAIDWLETHEQFLFGVHEAAILKTSLVWDVMVEGADRHKLAEFEKRFGKLKKGSTRFHNEKVTISAILPDLGTSELAEHGLMLKTHIATALGLPVHWLSEGGNANRACYSEDTQTLTENGWKFWYEIDEGERLASFNPDTEEIEFHVPEKRYVYDHDGEMYHFKGKRVDIMVTPDHKMFFKRFWRVMEHGVHDQWEITPANELPTRKVYFRSAGTYRAQKVDLAFFLPGAQYDPQSRMPDEEERAIENSLWLKFLGWYITEGWCKSRNSGKSWVVYLCQKDGTESDARMREVLEQMPFEYAVEPMATGVNKYRIHSKALYTWLSENCGCKSGEKRLPDYFRGLTRHSLATLFETIVDGDGHRDTRDGRTSGHIGTTSRVLADQLQEVCIRLNLSSRIGLAKKEGYQDGYRLCFSENPYQMVDLDRNLDRVHYKGKVYCFEVRPHHLMITRRGPHALPSIQSQTAAEMGLPTTKKLRSRQNFVRNMYSYIFDFAIDQAIIAGRLPADVDRRFSVISPQIWAIDTQRITSSLATASQALMIAEQQNWMTTAEAGETFKFVADQLGIGTLHFGHETDSDREVSRGDYYLERTGQLKKRLREIGDHLGEDTIEIDAATDGDEKD